MELSSEILSSITIYMKYSKYLPELKRRETWTEIVDRNKQMHLDKFPKLKDEIEAAYELVYAKKVLPSMRSLQFAGRPIKINNARLFNCSFLPMNHQDAFSEVMFLLLSGCGVGYSVQSHHVKKLPHIMKYSRTRRYLVADSIEGWADAIKVLLRAYFEGKPLPVFDFSDIRPKGAKLITSGGKAPGAAPLSSCLTSIQAIFDRKSNGDKLTTLEVHDICCYIADAVLAGGIRRSATISLFSLDDEEMLNCKGYYVLAPTSEAEENGTTIRFYVEYQGERKQIILPKESYDQYLIDNKLPWYHVAPHRARANNSATILRHKIDKETFTTLWNRIEESNAGEPGIFFTNNTDWGLNPCAEISLRSHQFCNLTTINAADVVDQEDLNIRAAAASFIGTLQASYTDFHYLREEWQETTEKDALVGVSITGLASTAFLQLDLTQSSEIVKKENARVAKLIGINQAARCTTVKPEGTTSLVVGSSSGIHAWHNDYYIRRMRVGKEESIYPHLAIFHPELIEDEHFRPNQQAIISVPIKAPDGAITRNESALDLLARVADVWKRWVKPGHRKGDNVNNVSTTVSIRPKEWKEVGEWMWNNRNDFTALSVLPHDDSEHTYIQAPFEDITKAEYTKLFKSLQSVDLSQVDEEEDGTRLNEQLACAGGSCEIV